MHFRFPIETICTRRVDLPIQITTTPVASGSSVPQWPTRICRLYPAWRRMFPTRVTVCRDVIPSGLSIVSRPLSVFIVPVDLVRVPHFSRWLPSTAFVSEFFCPLERNANVTRMQPAKLPRQSDSNSSTSLPTLPSCTTEMFQHVKIPARCLQTSSCEACASII